MKVNQNPTAFNFNLKDVFGKQSKAVQGVREGLITKKDVPLGNVQENEIYKSKCRNYYLEYKNCLKKTLFNRDICQQKEDQVIACQHRQGLYPSNEQIIKRLKIGLERSKERKEKKSEILNEKLNKQKTERIFNQK